MATAKSSRSSDEIAVLGERIFEQIVRPTLRPEDDGKYVAIDIDTGDYEMDASDYAAIMRLRGKHPEAEIWLMQAGFLTAVRFGGSR